MLCTEPSTLLGRAGTLAAPKQVLDSSAKCIVLILYFLSYSSSNPANVSLVALIQQAV